MGKKWKRTLAIIGAIIMVASLGTGFASGEETTQLPFVEEDLSSGMTASASSTTGTNTPALAVDKDTKTFWESGYGSDNAWLAVDLGKEQRISKVSINWGRIDYAVSYVIETSKDAETWKECYVNTEGKGGKETIEIDLHYARYVRVLCGKRTEGNQCGYSIYEMTVFGQKIASQILGVQTRDPKYSKDKVNPDMRFVTKINISDINDLNVQRFGTLFAREEALGDIELNLDTFNKREEYGFEVRNVPTTFLYNKYKSQGYYLSYCALTGLKPELRPIRYVARSYAICKDSNGEEVIIYSDTCVRSYDEAEDQRDKTEKGVGSVGEMLYSKSVSPAAAGVLTDNSGMSGLEAPNHLHKSFSGANSDNMYLSTSKTPIVIQYDKVEALGKMYIWNYNDTARLNYGMKDVKVEYSVNGTTYTELGRFTLAQSSASDNAIHGGNAAANQDGGNEPIDFGGVPGKYIKITPESSWGGSQNFGLSEIRVFRHKTRPSDGGMINMDAFTPHAAENSPSINVANNTGMSSTTGSEISSETHSNDPAGMWYTSNTNGSDASLILDLDGNYAVDTLKIWNYNNPANLNNGVQTFQVYYCVKQPCVYNTRYNTVNYRSGDWIQLGGSGKTYTLGKGTGAQDMAASLTLSMGGVRAQFIKIVPVTNYGGTGFGLSEVRAYAGKGYAVEPSRSWTGILSSSGTFKYQGNTSNDALSGRGSGWVSGDGVFATRLNGATDTGVTTQKPGGATDDSKTLFTFQDSFNGNFYNYKNFGTRYGYGTGNNLNLDMFNGAYMMLTGKDPDPRNIQFHTSLSGDLSNDHRLRNIMPNVQLPGESEPGGYWISDTTVIDGIPYIFCNAFIGLTNAQTDFLRHPLDSTSGFPNMSTIPQRVQSKTWTKSEMVKNSDGSYSEKNPNNSYHFETVLEKDGYIYLYGRRNNNLVVSRATPQNYKTMLMANFEFWNGSSWVKGDVTKAASIGPYPGNEFGVSYMESGPFAGKYLCIYTDQSVYGKIRYSVSDSVTGPFSNPSDSNGGGYLYSAPEMYMMWTSGKYAGSGTLYDMWCYNAKPQPAISAEGELLVTYHNSYDPFGKKAPENPDAWLFKTTSMVEYSHPNFINIFEVK